MSAPVYIINLPEATARLKHTEQQLLGVGVSGEVIPGIKGSELSVDDLRQGYSESLNSKHFRRPLSVGELGCYFSHRKAWEHMLDQGQSWALFLEDDIEVTPHLPAAMDTISTLTHFDLIKLSDNRSLPPMDQHKINDAFSVVSYSKMPNCAHGYALSRTGAEKLLKRKKVFRPVDVDFQFYGELELSVIGLMPYPVQRSHNFESQISQLGRNKEKNSTLPWRNWRYRTQIAWQRFRFESADLSIYKKRNNQPQRTNG